MSTATRYTGLIEHYRDRMPVTADTRVISLGEGNTPLIRLENIPGMIGKNVELYVKYEGLNPTGSFKDRGMTMAVTRAVEEGSKAIICASTGNTSAAAAAYAARAGYYSICADSGRQDCTRQTGAGDDSRGRGYTDSW